MTSRFSGLVGSWFLAPVREWYGAVAAEPIAGVYLVQSHSWFSGEVMSQELVRVEEMVDNRWEFFDEIEELKLRLENAGDVNAYFELRNAYLTEKD